MSDGALSQAEIDALLAGGGAPAASPAAVSAVPDAAAVGGFLTEIQGVLAENAGQLTGSAVKFDGPDCASLSADAFLADIPDSVCSVKIDFASGVAGEHLFIFPEDTAKAVVSLMNKEENVQLDEMAISVISEFVTQLTGAEITSFSQKTSVKGITPAAPEAAVMPKAAVPLPPGEFVRAAWNVDLGDGTAHTVYEVFGERAASAMASALRPPAPVPGGFGSGSIMGGSGAFGQAPSVSPVQFPPLASGLGARETGNIGILMDVSMEMTVELGRTKKQIREILSMGEGTIIELDKLAGEPVDILVNRKLIAKGEVVVIDENFGVRVTEIVSPQERVS